MSNYAEIGREAELLIDPTIVVKHIAGIPGGRSLDLSKYSNAVDGTEKVKAGHLIIRTKGGTYAPLNVADEGAYAALGEGEELAGVLEYSVTKSDPRAAILTAGQVNGKLLPYTLPEDVKGKLPRIEFLYVANAAAAEADEEE